MDLYYYLLLASERLGESPMPITINMIMRLRKLKFKPEDLQLSS